MPPDPLSEARVPMLSTSLSPTPSPLPSPSPSPRPHSPRTDAPVPPWVRQSPQRPTSGTSNHRRLSTPYSRSAAAADDSHAPLGQRVMRTGLSIANKMLKLFYTLTPLQRVLAVLALLAVNVLLILGMVYSHRIFKALGPVAQSWRALPGGWVIVFLMTCLSAFPPMIGYSTCVTIAGFVYGFPGGWPIVAGATVVGSLAAFVTSRTVFSGYVHSLVGADKRFVALGQVLRRDGLLVLAAIRFCPLPFSLSNGFLATISTISPLRFALATAMATPKLCVHVFIGSRLALLAESGDEMSVGDKVVNYLSMLVGSVVGIALSLFIYRRTMARAKELAREEGIESGVPIDGDVDLSYEDLEEGVLGGRQQRPGEADEAALMDDDDISLWETEGLESGYRDEDTDGIENGNGKQKH
ncbi:uncharacterized protein GGS22DRAFT_149565 [Annulohypoxylon maeteangense]|uniref:uncharacterized protein n=1 Tax=Annulohypoxylon maeteangense TaxID=1927788 RepID=UPI00200813E8|nr:uncharacterized protein GGS22DRAFT_149565 [Annulohypoxylon maeteangense]KAI0889943.1 hypothetical protein GGS22DRAFT_149565 [Annulohypoxylon maeteangense]